MRRRAWFIAVLWAVAAAGIGVEKCGGWADEAVKDVKNNISRVSEITKLGDKAEAVKTGASEVLSDAKDGAHAWSNWVQEHISEGLRHSEEELKEAAHSMADKAGGAALKTTQKINSAATDAQNYVSEKAGEAVKAATEKAVDVKTKAKDTAGEAVKAAKETVESGKEKAAEIYEALEEKVGEGVNCRDAREMVSKAADEIRATIRENTAEL